MVTKSSADSADLSGLRQSLHLPLHPPPTRCSAQLSRVGVTAGHMGSRFGYILAKLGKQLQTSSPHVVDVGDVLQGSKRAHKEEWGGGDSGHGHEAKRARNGRDGNQYADYSRSVLSAYLSLSLLVLLEVRPVCTLASWL